MDFVRHTLLVFDLDGTLVDSRADLVEAINAALQEVKLTPLPYSVIVSYIGEGSKKLVGRSLAYLNCADEEIAYRTEQFFYRYYYAHLHDHTTLYPGVAQTLSQLQCPKAVLTNKPTKMSCKILEVMGIAHHFQEIVGGDFPEDLKPNPVYLRKLVAKHQVSFQNTWMIGDSPIDIQTARNAGTKSVAVGYGFYKPTELRKENPDSFCDTFPELLKLNI